MGLVTAALTGIFLFQGCAALERARPIAAPERPPACVQLFSLLDQAVHAAGTGDAGSARVAGFPYLRTDRFLAGLGPGLASEEARTAYAAWMRDLDLAARAKEVANLPQPALEKLAAGLGLQADRELLFARVAACSADLAAHDRRDPEFWRHLTARVRVADEYSSAMQVAGLYPLAALPVWALTVRGQEKFRSWHRLPLEQLSWRGRPRAYLPAEGIEYAADAAAAILARAAQNPLGLPRPSAEEGRRLLAMFAPVIVQDDAGADDRPGALIWRDGRAAVAGGRPELYTYISYGLWKDAPVLQLNYVWWYAARSGPDAPWIEHGPLDGLTLRLSLAPDGTPVMLDAMNNCGCYHFFVPREEAFHGARTAPNELAPFVPRFLPQGFPARRLLVRVNSGWHQIDHIGISPPPPEAPTATYRLEPYDKLESLPAGEGIHASLFGPDGIAKGSGRIEPFLLFSMGVPDVGSMRQRGRHAILFIGRAHFDDPGLFDRNFK